MELKNSIEQNRESLQGGTYGVFLLLDVQNGTVFEGPLDEISLFRGALDVFALVDVGPEVLEVLDLDEVPDIGERGGDDGGFRDLGGGGDWRCHVLKVDMGFECLLWWFLLTMSSSRGFFGDVSYV